MAASRVRMTKQNLENTTMHVHRIRKSETILGLQIFVDFPFQKRRLKQVYNVSVPPHNWDLQVIEGKRNMTLKLCTGAVLANRDSDVQCSVLYDYNNDSWICSYPVKAVERSQYTYEMKLPANIIFHHGNKLLNIKSRVGCCLIVFTSVDTPKLTSSAGTRLFEKGQLPSLSLFDPKNVLRLNKSDTARGETSEEKCSSCYVCLDEERYLMYQLQENGAHSSFTDFSLCTQDGGVVEAHRSVLAVRSGFFRKLLREDEEAMSAGVDFPEIVVQAAVQFMYYSTIEVNDPLIVAFLLDLSVKLDIRSLDEVCEDYLKRNLSETLERLRRHESDDKGRLRDNGMKAM